MTKAELKKQFDDGKIDTYELQEQAEELGWDEDEYYAMCVSDGDGGWVPEVDPPFNAPRRDYSITEHILDFLSS